MNLNSPSAQAQCAEGLNNLAPKNKEGISDQSCAIRLIRRPAQPSEEKISRDIVKHAKQRPNSIVAGSSTINSLADLVVRSIRTDVIWRCLSALEMY